MGMFSDMGADQKLFRFFSPLDFVSGKIKPNPRSLPEKADRNQRDHVRSSGLCPRALRRRAGKL
jgi:hypothetical protein